MMSKVIIVFTSNMLSACTEEHEIKEYYHTAILPLLVIPFKDC